MLWAVCSKTHECFMFTHVSEGVIRRPRESMEKIGRGEVSLSVSGSQPAPQSVASRAGPL